MLKEAVVLWSMTVWSFLCIVDYYYVIYFIFSRLNTVQFSAPDPSRCGGTWTDIYLVGNFSSSAQFFVTLAALAFLYCIAALVVYIGYKHVYQRNSKFPLTVSNKYFYVFLYF